MVMGVAAPQFPFDQYLQGQTQYDPRFVAGKALGGIDLPKLISMYMLAKAQQPQQALPPGPPVTAGVDGAQTATPVQGALQAMRSGQLPNYGQLSMFHNVAYPGTENPYTAGMDPLKISQTTENYATAQKGLLDGNNDPMVDVYKSPDGKYSITQQPGSVKVGPVKLSQAFQYNMAGQLAETKQVNKTEDVYRKEWTDLTKAINPFGGGGGGGRGMSQTIFGKAANANRAATTGVKLLNKKDLTWQEFNAYVNSDFANLQRGGTPTDIQLSEANYHTAASQYGKMKTFFTGLPSTGLVPEGTREQMKQNFKELIDVDNAIIDDTIDYYQTAKSDVISRYPTRWESLRKAAEKVKDIEGVYSSTFNNPLRKAANSDISGMSDEELKRLALGGR